MGIRCENEGKYAVTLFRSLVAKELIKVYKLTQNEAAKKIGTTQAAVSQYLNSKRAKINPTKQGCLLPKIEKLSKRAAKRLAKGETDWEQVSLNFCKACLNGFEEQVEHTADHYVI